VADSAAEEALTTEKRGGINAEFWQIQYALGEKSKGRSMDYLAWHHMQGASNHKRINTTGEEESLPSYFDFISHHANATQAMIERINQAVTVYNRRVGKLMIMKGFNAPSYWADDEGIQLEAAMKVEMDEVIRLVGQKLGEDTSKTGSLFEVLILVMLDDIRGNA
jgi:hypothetical protein